MRRQMRKPYLSKKSFTYEIYVETSKAAHNVFQQKGASSIREFPLLHNLQNFLRMEIMAEDWVRLQLGMCLQLGVNITVL